jgi:hypothetical protein
MVKVTPSKLIREGGVVNSGQPKVVASCCVDGCPNEIEVVQGSPLESDEVENGRCFYPCSSHQKDPEVAQAVASLQKFLDE